MKKYILFLLFLILGSNFSVAQFDDPTFYSLDTKIAMAEVVHIVNLFGIEYSEELLAIGTNLSLNSFEEAKRRFWVSWASRDISVEDKLKVAISTKVKKNYGFLPYTRYLKKLRTYKNDMINKVNYSIDLYKRDLEEIINKSKSKEHLEKMPFQWGEIVKSLDKCFEEYKEYLEKISWRECEIKELLVKDDFTAYKMDIKTFGDLEKVINFIEDVVYSLSKESSLLWSNL